MKRLVAGVLALMAVVAACTNQHGPWLNSAGRRLEGSEVVEYDGFNQCGQESVVFLRFFGDQYAKDPDGVLGTLTSAEGRPLSFAVLDQVPDGAEPTGIHHGSREIYVDPATRADYIYIRLGTGQVERWPRAEVPCETEP